MKRCPNCQIAYEKGKFCSKCGKELIELREKNEEKSGIITDFPIAKIVFCILLWVILLLVLLKLKRTVNLFFCFLLSLEVIIAGDLFLLLAIRLIRKVINIGIIKASYIQIVLVFTYMLPVLLVKYINLNINKKLLGILLGSLLSIIILRKLAKIKFLQALLIWGLYFIEISLLIYFFLILFSREMAKMLTL